MPAILDTTISNEVQKLKISKTVGMLYQTKKHWIQKDIYYWL